MTDTKFTKGPWSVHRSRDGWPLVMAGGKIISNVNPESFSTIPGAFVEMPAYENAHLIAAAPELYDALQDCVDCLDMQEGYEPYDSVMKVLAKARGEA